VYVPLVDPERPRRRLTRFYLTCSPKAWWRHLLILFFFHAHASRARPTGPRNRVRLFSSSSIAPDFAFTATRCLSGQLLESIEGFAVGALERACHRSGPPNTTRLAPATAIACVRIPCIPGLFTTRYRRRTNASDVLGVQYRRSYTLIVCTQKRYSKCIRCSYTYSASTKDAACLITPCAAIFAYAFYSPAIAANHRHRKSPPTLLIAYRHEMDPAARRGSPSRTSICSQVSTPVPWRFRNSRLHRPGVSACGAQRRYQYPHLKHALTWRPLPPPYLLFSSPPLFP
jgi:hypothetical protein